MKMANFQFQNHDKYIVIMSISQLTELNIATVKQNEISSSSTYSVTKTVVVFISQLNRLDKSII